MQHRNILAHERLRCLPRPDIPFVNFLFYYLEGTININVLKYLSRWSVWSANCGTVYDKSCAFPSGILLIPETYALDTLNPFLQASPYLDGRTWMLR